MPHAAPASCDRGDRRFADSDHLAGTRAGRSPRALGRAHDADLAVGDRDDGGGGEERRLQHAAGAGARPRRRLLPAGDRAAPAALAAQPAFDPLATTIAKAHEAGLQVHAWINVNLVASAAELPAAREHVIYRHPEWLMVPRALADELSTVDPHSPGYRRTPGALCARAVGGSRRPVPLAGVAGIGGLHDRGRARHRAALRHRRRPPRLHPLSDQRLRLQPRHAGGVPAIGGAGPRGGRPAPLRRTGRRRRAARSTRRRFRSGGAASAPRG